MKSVIEDFELGELYNIKKNESIFDETMTPSVILYNPKYAHNVGSAVRGASCFGGKAVIFTGNRILIEPSKKKPTKYRIPREERMKGYKEVLILRDDYPINRFKNITPVAVELRDNSEPLPSFVHPTNPVYIFGPEDGSIPQVVLKQCHRFIVIPSKYCVNLAVAVNLILYDRAQKLGALMPEDIERLNDKLSCNENA